MGPKDHSQREGTLGGQGRGVLGDRNPVPSKPSHLSPPRNPAPHEGSVEGLTQLLLPVGLMLPAGRRSSFILLVLGTEPGPLSAGLHSYCTVRGRRN